LRDPAKSYIWEWRRVLPRL